MARRSPDDYSNSSDDRSRDLTAQFWGKSPSWRTTGSYRGSRRNGDRTGPVARTRRHGDPTGQIPIVPTASAIEEPLIDPYDFGFDDVGYGPDQGIAGKRVDTQGRTSVPVPSGIGPSQSSRSSSKRIVPDGSRDPVSTLAQRLGLGAVDPLLLRLGAIVMIGVLARAAGDELPARLEQGHGPDRGHLGFVGGAARAGRVGRRWRPRRWRRRRFHRGRGDRRRRVVRSAIVRRSSGRTNDVAARPRSRPSNPQTTVDVGDVTESAAAGISASGSVSDAVEAVQSTQVMVSTAGAAKADEPANPAPTACQLPYTVGAGDYWIRIADAADVYVEQSCCGRTWHRLPRRSIPGDDICLPEGATLPSPPTVTTAARAATAPSTSPRPPPRRRPRHRPPRPRRRPPCPSRPQLRGRRSRR